MLASDKEAGLVDLGKDQHGYRFLAQFLGARLDGVKMLQGACGITADRVRTVRQRHARQAQRADRHQQGRPQTTSQSASNTLQVLATYDEHERPLVWLYAPIHRRAWSIRTGAVLVKRTSRWTRRRGAAALAGLDLDEFLAINSKKSVKQAWKGISFRSGASK
ncbi:hypothetical protein D3C72_1619160 [compost metagenome]